jgi:hypothetical protein
MHRLVHILKVRTARDLHEGYFIESKPRRFLTRATAHREGVIAMCRDYRQFVLQLVGCN